MSSKLGRKGDPRMHKAVAARLENPSLSLYEALCIGGFDYSENDDKSVTDEKRVTLGQRKNQLSRRLRLARKQGAGQSKHTYCVRSPTIQRAMFDDKITHRHGTNEISLSKRDRIASRNLNSVKPLSSQGGPNRTKTAIINELGTSSFNNHTNGRNGEMMGAQQQKHQRFTRCLNSTQFDKTCSTTPAIGLNQKINTNQYLQPGWPVGNVLPMGGPGAVPQGTMVGATQGVNLHPVQYYNAQMTNRIPDQQRYQQGTSGVALSSLAATARSVGLTLDQLALTLSSDTTSLSKLVAEVRSGDSEAKQEQMALNLYQTDVKGLYTKCLLMAGFDSSLAEQNTPTYIKFATKVWEEEGRRLRSLQDALRRSKEAKNEIGVSSPPPHRQGTPTLRNTSRSSENNDAPIATTASSDSDGQHRNHDSDSNNGRQVAANGNTSGTQDKNKCDARHMHRLGDCGHRPIIHQPKDGAAHIDFIVNDQIECYAGHDTMSLTGRSVDSAWPSKYKCKDLGSGESCAKGNCSKSVTSELEATWGNMDSLVQDPKIFKLSEIDTGDPEWTFDTNEDVDGGAIGLFKLGRESSSELAN